MARETRRTDSAGLAEVVELILDKGLVIDVWAKVSLVGIELLRIEARVVVASVETFLKYADAIGITRDTTPALPHAQSGGAGIAEPLASVAPVPA